MWGIRRGVEKGSIVDLGCWVVVVLRRERCIHSLNDPGSDLYFVRSQKRREVKITKNNLAPFAGHRSKILHHNF